MIQTLDGFNRNIKVNFKQIYSDPLIKLKKYADTSTMLGPAIDKNANPVTGLTEDKQIRDSKGKMQTILGTRRVMEKELDLPEGSLKVKGDHWRRYGVPIGSKAIELNLTDPYDLLKYLFLHAQNIVATSIDEASSKYGVEYVMYSEEEEASKRVQSRRVLKGAYRLSDELDMETKINILAVYGYIADSTKPSQIDDAIDTKIESNPVKFMKIANDDFLKFRSLVTKALDAGVLSIVKGAIMHSEIEVGYDKQSAAKALAGNNKLATIIRAKLSGDMDIIKDALKGE